MDLLDKFAPYYDLEYASYTDDLDMYRQLAALYAPEEQDGARVLELACGSGRILMALAELEHTCTGVDASLAMLELARRHAEDRGLKVELVLGRMQDRGWLSSPGSYDLIICALNSFSYLPDRVDQMATLESICEALSPDGRLVLDLTPPGNTEPFPADGELVLQGRWPYAGGEVLKLVSGTWDAAAQIHYVNWIYDQTDADGILRRTVIEQNLRYVYPAEAELLVEAVGMEVEGVYGSYNLDPFDSSAERMIVLARRVVIE